MEPFKRFIGTVLFVLVLMCGLISTFSLLLLTTNSAMCGSNQTQEQRTAISTTATYILVCLGLLEAINLLKHVFLSCQTYDQCWPKGPVLAWILVSTSLSTTGLCILLFYILPRVDLIRGVLLLNSFGLIPLALKVFLIHDFNSRRISYKPLFAISLLLQVVALSITMLTNFTSDSFTLRDDSSLQRNQLIWTSPALDSLAVLASILLVPFYWLDSYIYRDIKVMGRVVPLISFKRQLTRSKHKAGLILPLWKGLWIALYVFAFIPGYFKMEIACDHLSQTATEDPKLQIDAVKTELVGLLRIDEKHGNDYNKMPDGILLDWRGTYRRKEFDPSWIPPKNVAPVRMKPTDEIMSLIEMLRRSKEMGDTVRFHKLRAELDSIILHGRYTKKTIQVYINHLSYIEGTHSTPPPSISKVNETAYRVLAVVFICSSVIAVISAKAACQWRITKFSYIIPTCLIMPLSVVLTVMECEMPSTNLAPLMKCAEPWSAMSAVVLVSSAAWYSSQILLLLHGYGVEQHVLESSSNFSIPLISSMLVFGGSNSIVKSKSRMSTVLRSSGSYKFSFINQKRSKDSESDEDSEKDNT